MSSVKANVTIDHKDLEALISRAFDNLNERQAAIEVEVMRHQCFGRESLQHRAEERLAEVLAVKNRLSDFSNAVHANRWSDLSLVIEAVKGEGYAPTRRAAKSGGPRK